MKYIINSDIFQKHIYLFVKNNNTFYGKTNIAKGKNDLCSHWNVREGFFIVHFLSNRLHLSFLLGARRKFCEVVVETTGPNRQSFVVSILYNTWELGNDFVANWSDHLYFSYPKKQLQITKHNIFLLHQYSAYLVL